MWLYVPSVSNIIRLHFFWFRIYLISKSNNYHYGSLLNVGVESNKNMMSPRLEQVGKNKSILIVWFLFFFVWNFESLSFS